MLLENIYKIFEDSPEGSLDYMVSEFILLNLYDLNQYSINDIAKHLNIPKSSAASFFSRSRLNGGYPLFLRALNTELGMNSISASRFIQDHKTYVSHASRRIERVSQNSLKRVVDEMSVSRNILFIGPKNLRECADSLSALLWHRRIPNRYIITASVARYDQQLRNLTDDDLIIFLFPYIKYSELLYTINSFQQISTTLINCAGRHLYLQSDDQNRQADTRVIDFKAPVNRLELKNAAELFFVQLCIAAAEEWITDPKALICNA